ncbi:hypothetical protein ACE6H2_006735 [Prunus campanulata]
MDRHPYRIETPCAARKAVSSSSIQDWAIWIDFKRTHVHRNLRSPNQDDNI